jgi:hypothetical protein
VSTDLAEGGYIDRAEPVLLIGECGTGRTEQKFLVHRARHVRQQSHPRIGGYIFIYIYMGTPLLRQFAFLHLAVH